MHAHAPIYTNTDMHREAVADHFSEKHDILHHDDGLRSMLQALAVRGHCMGFSKPPCKGIFPFGRHD